MQRTAAVRWILILLAVWVMGGCANSGNPIDPWEKSNRFFYNLNDGMDKYALKPASDVYVKIVPEPIRTCLQNGFDNMEYGNVIVNDFLQGNWHQGASDSVRMFINSTVGIGGLFDVASHMDLPSHDNDFGITLGKWGVQAGPYMVLPFFGPSTARDAPGILVGLATEPIVYIADMPLAAAASLEAVETLVQRARAESEVRFRDAAAIDPYIFTRDAYLQYREGQIHPENKKKNTESIYDEDNEPTTAPATRPNTTIRSK
jgi:phospholipid-binding lipoprotein MlaA